MEQKFNEDMYYEQYQQPVYVIPEAAPKKKGPMIALIASVVALVVILAGTVVAMAANGVFLSKPQKVAKAIGKTLSDSPQFVKDLELKGLSELAQGDKYTMDMEAEFNNVHMEASLINTPKKKQVVGEVNAQGMTVKAQGELDEESLRVQVPLLTKDVFVYNYKDEELGGFLGDALKQQGLSVEDLNKSLETVFSQEEQVENAEEFAEELEEFVESLKWENTDKKSFTVDGNSIKATGYKVTITRTDAEHFVQLLDEYMLTVYKDDVDALKDSFEQLYDACRYMPDVECNFYIYKNKLAAIFVEADNGYECELKFKGGDFRMQNMELEISAGGGRTVSVELEGKMKGAKEVYELSAYGMVLATFQYDTKSGRYDFSIVNDYLSVDGKLVKNKDERTFTMNMGSDFYFGITYKKGADTVEFDGRERNVNDMSEEDWMELFSGLATF